MVGATVIGSWGLVKGNKNEDGIMDSSIASRNRSSAAFVGMFLLFFTDLK